MKTMITASSTIRVFILAGSILLFNLHGTLPSADAADGSQEQTDVIPGDKAAQYPFLGDWQGKFQAGWAAELVAQVIPRGPQQYLIQLLPAFDHRCPPLALIEATADGTVLRFEHGEWSGTLEGETFHGKGPLRGKPTEFTLKKVVRLSTRLGAEPPPEAIVLYDGESLAQWESDGRGGVEEITWKQIDEYLRVWPPLDQHSFAAAIRTRQAWPSFQLHLEFRLPLIASATGQTRGNSGMIIEEFEFYEVQILDSYGLPGYWDEAGAIYKKEAPKVNMCAPPGQWQSYDIRYHGPRFDESGELVAKPRITVDLNGKRIHNDVELPYSEGAEEPPREAGSQNPRADHAAASWRSDRLPEHLDH